MLAVGVLVARGQLISEKTKLREDLEWKLALSSGTFVAATKWLFILSEVKDIS